MKLFTYVTIVLMLMSVFSTGAFAASSGGNGNNGMGGQVNEVKNQEGEENRISVSGNDDPNDKGATERRQKNRDDYFAAKKKLQQVNANMNSGKINASSKEVFDVRKEYLLETINYTISNLEELKEKVDDSQREDADVIIAEIDEYISELDTEKDNVENSTTTKELAKSARNIRDIWRDAVKDAYKTRTTFVDEKVGTYLNRSVSLSERLSKEIETLQQQGKDTTELEELLQGYNGLIEQARQNRERAREAYQNGDDTSREYWSASAENLKDANAVLARISQILKTYRQGVVSLNGDGTLLAEGNGTAVLSGDITAEMTIDDAQLVIKDHAGDAKIKISNGSEIFLELDNSLAAEQKRALVYSDLTANVSISGSRLTIMVKGTEVDLKVEGIGSAVLSGEGTYTAGTGEESKHWASQFESDPEEGSSQEE
ncbi:MAG: hypothetical protein A4E24_00221 [Methanomethylovorans sp. PtaU1.Bin093]|uniref:hypothetical protein n=1 Tax=Methanomethylovorans sp. PtaU1.Bin093 TaxID=1811679 RepID=UPI0009C68D1A|nr:hypothetical protein [Methanomethylovorans sp. PtaU1.Bin093]OPY22179.1 MAG: hypothetical protein A4E24_00221 [Methanomethylovorans sp. PtaU1.Bin093]